MASPSASVPRVAGIDGCRGGWVVAGRGADGPTAQVVPDLHDVVADLRAGRLDAVAIDMPIGLLDDRPRPADVAARRLLGPRRSSVFPSPLRVVLGSLDYADACARSRAASGKALSKQSYHLLPKIAEIDELIEPEDQDRWVEAHPELAFARLDGDPLADSKHTPEGRRRRIDLLVDALGPGVRSLLDAEVAPTIDLLDALALVVTADHLAAGSDQRVGGELDARGLRAEVVW